MTKSKIIKEYVNGEKDLFTTLRRTKVLLHALKGETKLEEWANQELTGYTSVDKLPAYRKGKAHLEGSFDFGGYTYKNHVLPLVTLDEKMSKFCTNIDVRDGIRTLLKLEEEHEDNKIGVHVPVEFFDLILKDTNIEKLHSARVVPSTMIVHDIIDIVGQKTLDILLLLEDEYGCLDEMDLNIVEDSAKADGVSKKIYQIIYNDNSISIGDNNLVSKSELKTERTESDESMISTLKKSVLDVFSK
jgi:hypothetical protein